MSYVFDRKGILELEKIISEKSNCTFYDMMSVAATGCSHFIRDYWPQAEKIAVVCGPGRNGGDGYLIARDLLSRGYDVSVFSMVPLDSLKGDAKLASNSCLEKSKTITVVDNDTKIESDLIIDAIFGIGLSKSLEGTYKKVVEYINSLPTPVCSVDIPSGLDADTGVSENGAIIANATVTFIANKIGLLCADAKAYVGFLHLDTLDYKIGGISKRYSVGSQLFFDSMLEKRPYRLPTVHKNQVGQVAVVGGASSLGAVILSAQAAYRVGSGRVEVFTSPENAKLVPIYQPEIISNAIDSFEELALSLNRFDTVIVGPGLGVDDWARGCLSAVLSARKPMVVDADALFLLPSINDIKFSHNDVVLTPHLGEAHYLLNSPVKNLYKNFPKTVKQISEKYNATALLKGSGTLVASGSDLSISTYGNSGMAVAGMGDLLSGVIGGLIAQNLDAYDATCLGTVLHSVAAEMKYESLGNGLMPSDLLTEIAGLLVGSSDG